MADIECYFTTFNCGRQPVHVDYFASNLLNAFKGTLPPHLIVLSLQEIAPIGYSFLGGSLLTPYFARIREAVALATTSRFGKDVAYDTVLARNVGMTAIMVLRRQDFVEQITSVQTAGVGVGVWDMGNKGATGVRLALASSDADSTQEIILTFVAAHLAPMEDKCDRRNQDWRSICEGLVFEAEPGTKRKAAVADGQEAEPLLNASNAVTKPPGSLFDPPSHIYFAGDLNYRTSDTPPQPNDHSTWPQPTSSTSDPHHYNNLLPHDQLTRERTHAKTLHLLSEPPITFPPTYKYSDAARKHIASALESSTPKTLSDGRVNETSSRVAAVNDDVWLWAKHRVPSWCDRILYLAAAPPVKVHAYDALPLQPTSDHRPVALSFTLNAKPVEAELQAPFAVRQGWRERRAAARRYEVIVGLAAYLGLTWEGEALLAGTVVGLVGGYLVFRALLAA